MNRLDRLNHRRDQARIIDQKETVGSFANGFRKDFLHVLRDQPDLLLGGALLFVLPVVAVRIERKNLVQAALKRRDIFLDAPIQLVPYT